MSGNNSGDSDTSTPVNSINSNAGITEPTISTTPPPVIGTDNLVVIGAAAGGGALACVLLLIIVLICCCCCCWQSRQRSLQTKSLKRLPQFRVLDAHNPTYYSASRLVPGASIDGRMTWPRWENSLERPIERRPNSLQHTLPSLPLPNCSKGNSQVFNSAEYSYATPDELTILPKSRMRSDTEEYCTPVDELPNGVPTSPRPSSYTVPVLTLKDTSNSIHRKTIHSGGIYMRPASTEESLYCQIKLLKVQHIKKDLITLLDLLGSGQFGNVVQGEYLKVPDSDPEPVAIKTLKMDANLNDKIKFLQEAAIMAQFRHPNVVLLHGVVNDGDMPMIVLELMPRGDLRNFLINLRSCGDSVKPEDLLNYCHQIASGMEYLAKKCFVHRDLAARNILVDDQKRCKVGDFGMARDLEDENYYISQGGKIPVKWTSPEALFYKKYSTASDVWSFGVLMYEIWSLGHKPFEGRTNKEALDLVESGYRLPPPPGCPRAVYHLMMQCWNFEHSKRPSFEDILIKLSEYKANIAEALMWSEDDKKLHPDVATLGAELLIASELFSDLQQLYMNETNSELSQTGEYDEVLGTSLMVSTK